MPKTFSPPPAMTNRLVLLGASNLTVSLRRIIQCMQHHCGGPSEILVAAGHGRSYGQDSQFLGRELPGIAASELWAQLDDCRILPTYAFLTDIGNDILYGAAAAQILDWVGWCIEHLQQQSDQIIVTDLPLASIESLPAWRYKLFRNLFYPYCRLSLDEVRARARAVHRGLLTLAAHQPFVLQAQHPEWMGADAIHHAYRKRDAFYQQVFRHLRASPDTAGLDGCKRAVSQRWLRRPKFAYKKVLGWEQRHPQPSGILLDGSVVSLY